MDIFDRILLLKNSPVFEQVSTEDLRHVAQAMETENYLAGERIFDINENGDHMYVIKSGSVGISLNENISVKEFVARLEAGECFGEMNLLDNLPRSATAQEPPRQLTLRVHLEATCCAWGCGFSMPVTPAHYSLSRAGNGYVERYEHEAQGIEQKQDIKVYI